MVCAKIIHLFLVNSIPKVFADKLDDIELIAEAWAVSGELLNQTLSNSKAHLLKFSYHLILQKQKWGKVLIFLFKENERHRWKCLN